MNIRHAVTLVAALTASTSLLANEPIKTKTEPEKYGRAADKNTVKCGGASDKPGRAAEECTVKSGGKPKIYGRSVEQ